MTCEHEDAEQSDGTLINIRTDRRQGEQPQIGISQFTTDRFMAQKRVSSRSFG